MLLTEAAEYAKTHNLTTLKDLYKHLIENWETAFPNSNPYAELEELDAEIDLALLQVDLPEVDRHVPNGVLNDLHAAVTSPDAHFRWRSSKYSPLSKEEREFFCSLVSTNESSTDSESLVDPLSRLVLKESGVDYLDGFQKGPVSYIEHSRPNFPKIVVKYHSNYDTQQASIERFLTAKLK